MNPGDQTVTKEKEQKKIPKAVLALRDRFIHKN